MQNEENRQSGTYFKSTKLNNFSKLFSKNQIWLIARRYAYNHPAMLQNSRPKLYYLQY